MNNVLLDKGIILPSGELSKDKINLVAGAITQPLAEMVWITTFAHNTFAVDFNPYLKMICWCIAGYSVVGIVVGTFLFR